MKRSREFLQTLAPLAAVLALGACLPASAQTVQLGYVSLERVVPSAPGVPGSLSFRVVNLTGPAALPPEARVSDSITLQSATLTYRLSSGSLFTVNLGDLTPGLATLPISLSFPDTESFLSAEFRATLSTRIVNLTGTSAPVTLSPGEVVVNLAGAPNLTPGQSAPILATAAPALRLAFLQQPTNVPAGTIIAPPVTVRVLDSNNNVVPSTAAISLISSPPGINVTASAENGVATFATLVLSNPGAYTLTASAPGIQSAVSNTFTIGSLPASRIEFVASPVGGVIGVPLGPVSVRFLDANNSPVPSTASVTLTSVPPAINLTAAAVNGIATFNGLVFPNAGLYSLTAATSGLSPVSTAPFPIQTAAVGTVNVSADRPAYAIGETVTVRGRVTDAAAAPIPATPVVLVFTRNGVSRTLSATTAADGSFVAAYAPAPTEAGSIQVTATATAGGVTRTATASFRVVGLQLQLAADDFLDLVMGSTKSPGFTVRNTGDGALSGLNITATASPLPALTARLNLAGVSASLPAGASGKFTLDLTAAPGTPSPAPIVFTVRASAIDTASNLTISQAQQITVFLRPSAPSPMLSPLTATLGVNPGSNAQQQYAVRNDGFVPMENARIDLVNPGATPWISIADQNLGRIEPGQSKTFRLLAAPPASVAPASFTVPFVLSGGPTPVNSTLTVNVSNNATGSASFNIQNDLGVYVSGATVTLISKANSAITFQAASNAAGIVTFTGVTAGDYNFVVTAPNHSPSAGSVRVTAGGAVQPLDRAARNAGDEPEPIQVILSFDVVTLSFAVTPTSIPDLYETELRIRYSTFLVKPVLRVTPFSLDYAFQPQSSYPPYPQCFDLEIENLHPTSKVSAVTLNSESLDAGTPGNLRFKLKFFLPGEPLTGPGSTILDIGDMAGRNLPVEGAPNKRTVKACGTVEPNFLQSRDLGSLTVSGQYLYSDVQAVTRTGTTSTPVPVSYRFPTDFELPIISLIHDTRISPNDLRPADANYPLYNVKSLRPEPAEILKPSNPVFGGRNLVAFAERVVAPPQLLKSKQDLQTILANNPLWRANFFDPDLPGRAPKDLFTGVGDLASFDIATTDFCALDLVSCLRQKLSTPDRDLILNSKLYVGFAAQWSDRVTGPLPGPDGYKAPIRILRLTETGGVVSVPGGAPGGGAPTPLPRSCTAEYVPGEYVPVECGQILIAIDFKQTLERQAFNARMGIAPAVPLSNVRASLSIKTLAGADATDLFTIVVAEDSQGATRGGTVSTPQIVHWQLIPKVGAGGVNGNQFLVSVKFEYSIAAQNLSVDTSPVTISVSPLPQLEVTYSVPFLVIQKKPARIRVEVRNNGNGPANNLSISSLTPIRILSRPGSPDNPPLPTTFTLVGASSTADGSTYLDGINEVQFGVLQPKSTVSGFFNLLVDECIENPLEPANLWRRITNCGYIVDSTATMKQKDFNGVQLDPLVGPPIVKFIPTLGGTVSTTAGPRNGLIVTARKTDGTLTRSDTTDADGGYFIQDLTAGAYEVKVATGSGTVLATSPADILGDSSTNFLNFTVTPPSSGPVDITVGTTPAGLAFTVDGIEYRAAQTFKWQIGSTHSIGTSATQQLAGAPRTRYAFSTWSNGGPAVQPALVAPSGPTTFTAAFVTQHEILRSPAPATGGTVNGPSGYLNAGTAVSLTASANTGYRFSSWSGDATGTANPLSLVLNKPLTVVANFAPLAPILSASITSRTGAADARDWTIRLTNSGIGVAENPRITNIVIAPAGAPGCNPNPQVLSPALPIALPTINPLGNAQTVIRANFAGCQAAQRFTVTVSFSANNGAYTHSTTFNNQFR